MMFATRFHSMLRACTCTEKYVDNRVCCSECFRSYRQKGSNTPKKVQHMCKRHANPQIMDLAENIPIRLGSIWFPHSSVPISGFATAGKTVWSSKSGRGLTIGMSTSKLASPNRPAFQNALALFNSSKPPMEQAAWWTRLPHGALMRCCFGVLWHFVFGSCPLLFFVWSILRCFVASVFFLGWWG